VPAPDETLLWLVDTGALSGAALDGYAGWLGDSERERCARFVRAERRRQFIVGRVLLRHALGRLLRVAPRSIALRERPGQAPALDTPAPGGVGFSISHSGPWVACAASAVCALGLDIERLDAQRDVLALAQQALGPEAVAQLVAIEGQERVDAFYRLWCLHEARIKLGEPSAADYIFTLPGLALALRSAVALPAAPVPLVLGAVDGAASLAPR
jgi:4'-phosphopantetheinyl transferase